MKKTKLTRSLLAACSIVALAAVMYGCESGPSQSELDDETARAEAAEAAQAEAEAKAAAEAEAKAAAEAAARAAAAAEAAAEAARAEAEAQAAADAAAAEAAEAAAAAAAAEAADEAAAAATAKAAQEAAEAQAKAAADAAAEAAAAAQEARDAAAEAAKDQAEAEAAQEAAEEAEEEAAEKLADELAKQKADKLGALFRGLLRADDATITPAFTAFVANPTIEAAHGMVANIYAPDIGDTTAPAVGSDAAFALVKPTALDALGDWTGADIKATNAAGVVDHVNVYTDVNVGTELSFDKLFPDTAGADDYAADTRIVTASGLNKHQGLVMAMMENDDGEMVNVFQTESGTRTHGSPALDQEVFEIVGTFAGATGTYQCTEGAGTADPCTSTGTNLGTMLSGVDDTGANTTNTTGSWTFNPDAGELASVPDGNYAYFGWWLRIGADGAWDVDAFHGVEGLVPVDANPDPALTGSATYKGQAAGKAAINPQLPGVALMGGAFTADATLTADFEADDGITANTDDRGMISGMIDNFMVDGEEVDWTVALGATPIIYGALTATPAVRDFNNGSTTWMIDGKGSSSNGTWSGSFYNASAADGVPTVVTGEFTATYNSEVGRMEGAFGANKE